MNRWYALLAVGVAAIGVQLSLRPDSINHDAAMFLDCGRMLLEGLRPYVDFSDLNPPMIMYVSALPAGIAAVLSMPPIAAFNLFVLLLALYSAFASTHLISRSKLDIRPPEAGVFGLGVLLFSACLFWTGDNDWGQREHLFLLLYLPLFFVRWIRWEEGHPGRWLPPVAGLLAGAGACLKPHFVILGFAVEVYFLARKRRWRPFLAPEAILVVVAGLAYAMHFLFLPDPVRETFFGYIVPLVREGYGVYARPVLEVLRNPGVPVAVLGGVAGWILARRDEGSRGALVRAFGVMAVVGAALYVQQGKGWSYHLIPAVFAGLAAFLFGAGGSPGLLRSGPPSPQRLAVLLILGVALLFQTARWGLHERAAVGPARDVLHELLVRSTRPDDAVLMISTSVAEVYPLLLHADRSPGSRFLWTFPLPMLYADHPGAPEGDFPYRSRESMGAREGRFLSELSADIAHRRPAVILVNGYENPQGCPPGFTLPGYLRAAGLFEEAMAGYRFWNEVFGWRIYAPERSPLLTGPPPEND